MPARKLAETDAQIQALHHHVLAQCVAITSSIDTIPPEIILDEMRERWLVELRQTVVALGLVVERLADGPKVEATL
jgi:DNA-directed RNA polymerase specialized sigma54-like protein